MSQKNNPKEDNLKDSRLNEEYNGKESNVTDAETEVNTEVVTDDEPDEVSELEALKNLLDQKEQEVGVWPNSIISASEPCANAPNL